LHGVATGGEVPRLTQGTRAQRPLFLGQHTVWKFARMGVQNDQRACFVSTLERRTRTLDHRDLALEQIALGTHLLSAMGERTRAQLGRSLQRAIDRVLVGGPERVAAMGGKRGCAALGCERV
jgi:hypothetical protein